MFPQIIWVCCWPFFRVLFKGDGKILLKKLGAQIIAQIGNELLVQLIWTSVSVLNKEQCFTRSWVHPNHEKNISKGFQSDKKIKMNTKKTYFLNE